MQNLLKTESLSSSRENATSQGGFSLLEAILAIGILSVVCIQIINVQSASMEIVAVSRANQIATWAMRSANAQLQYVLDAYGVEGLRPLAEFKAGPDKDFNVTIETAETTIEASRLFITAMRMTKVLGGGAAPADEDEKNAQESQFKEIGDALDSQVPKDIYRTIKVKVTWRLANTERSMDGGFLVVDDKGLTIGEGLESFAGATGTNANDSGGGAGNSSGQAGNSAGGGANQPGNATGGNGATGSNTGSNNGNQGNNGGGQND